MEIMQVSFTHPTYLWNLIIVPFLVFFYFLSLKYSKSFSLKFANFVALSRVSGGVNEPSIVYVLIIRTVALICIILSISGMTLWYVGETDNKDYVLAIDVSSSMMQADFFPNRLDAAKEAAINFVESIPFTSRVALLTFSGTSFVDQPLTLEKNLVVNAIKNLTSNSVGGTDIGNAVITSSNLLLSSKKAKVIILLTDGRSNIGVSEDTAIAYAIDSHVVVNTVGIGNLEDNEFNLGINQEELKDLSDFTLGTSYIATTPEELEEIYLEIGNGTKTSNIPWDLSFILLILALVLLVSDWLLGDTIYRRIP